MNTLIERLRTLKIIDEVGSSNQLANEAADEIERLQRENKELRKELAALKSQASEPVAVVHEVYVAPNSDGKSRAIVLSDERLSQGAELYVTPPTALVEQKCLEVAGAVWALAAPDKVVDSKALIAVVHSAMREGE